MPTTPQYQFPYPAPTDQPDGAAQIQALAQRIEAVLAGQATVPSGVISPFGGPNAPAGWLLCDGAAISRATYAALFAIVGTAFGAGDGSTTFNTPNLRGRSAVGLDAAQTEYNAIGKTGGAKTHALTIAEMPAHDHGGKTAAGVTGTGVTGGATTGDDSPDHGHNGSTSAVGTHNHGLNTASGTAVYNDFGAFASGLKAGTSASNLNATVFQPDGAHSHSVSVGGATARHAHSVPGLSVPSLTVPQLTISSQGSATPVALDSPYVVVNHIIKT